MWRYTYFKKVSKLGLEKTNTHGFYWVFQRYINVQMLLQF